MATKLTPLQIDALKKPGKHSVGGDGCGYLYLEISKAGGKVFRLKYRLDGKENRYTIGAYPKTSLKQARDEAVRARALIDEGRHPVDVKREEAEDAKREAVLAQENVFRVVAERYLNKKTKLAASTRAQYRRALENHVYPVLGDMPVADIKATHVTAVIDRLDESPAMARYALGVTKAVLAYAESRGLITQNVAVGRQGALPDHSTKSHAAFTRPDQYAQLGELVRKIDGYHGANASVGNALRLLARIACRPAEIVAMHWRDVDLDTATWRYIITKTKSSDGTPKLQFVPLSRQSVEILRPLREASEGRGYVFPSPGNAAGHIQADSLLVALINGLGYKRGQITAHGFRASFQSIAYEQLGVDRVTLELMLGHKMPGVLGDTYMRAELEEQRREAAQKWSDWLDSQAGD
ncbi:tyrosine-type recombinase/integrase [Pseudomonas asiatica]|uniref:tyrosine-type recombinase/integrase n=1 Tax=Pseudomonas asiatica TaxID=2219225 RepID=UPI0018D97EBF|nr:integrase arm-type DNA-binding domain-containing protein [Pseudomonas asiatica]MBH3378356.1 integrase arm-type DNA-binding domain-containing protein [Pseudomonas asiatica]